MSDEEVLREVCPDFDTLSEKEQNEWRDSLRYFKMMNCIIDNPPPKEWTEYLLGKYKGVRVHGYDISTFSKDELMALVYDMKQDRDRKLVRIGVLNQRLCDVYIRHRDVVTKEEVGYMDGYIF